MEENKVNHVGLKVTGILLAIIAGIALLAEFAISICKDAGENSIASKVEMGSKVIIISMSIPIISNLLEIIIKILPN
jgi:stage III sporulation protein AD